MKKEPVYNVGDTIIVTKSKKVHVIRTVNIELEVYITMTYHAIRFADCTRI